MKLKKLFVAAALALGLGVGAVAGISANKGAMTVSASKESTHSVTVYYAITSTDLGSSTLKLNVKRDSNDDTSWQTVEMNDTLESYGDYKLFSAAYDAWWEGSAVMQFQLFTGGKWASQEEVHSSWVSESNYSGKVRIKGQPGWYNKSSCPDAPFSVDVYVCAYDWANLYVYTYETISGGEFRKNGDFPGKQVAFTDTNLQFNGANRLQKITVPYSNISNVRFQISDGTDSHKSAGDLTLTAGAYYYYHDSAWSGVSGDMAAAAAFVEGLNTERLSVAASEKVKQYSICGLSASKWVGLYNDLSEDAKDIVDAASIWTYTNKNSGGADKRVTFAEVMAELADRNARGVGGALTANVLDNNSGFVVGAGIAVLAALLLGSLFFVTKKKRQF